MTNLGNKITNIFIILFLVGVLGYFGSLGLQYYNSINSIYNDNIVDFTIELIKGNKSLEDIDTLNVSEEIKKNLKDYYNTIFFSDEDSIIIYDDMQLLEEVIVNAKKIQNKYLVNGYLDIDKYYEEIANTYDFISNAPTGEDEEYAKYLETIPDIEQKIKEYTLYSSFNLKTTNVGSSIYIEGNKLFIKIKDLVFENGMTVENYKGVNFYIYQDMLDKKIKEEVENSENRQSIKIKNITTLEKNKRFEYVLIDDLGNIYTFEIEMGKSKIKSVIVK